MKTPVKVGLVGIGRAGWGMHCPELKDRTDRFEMEACCDVLPERLRKMEAQYPGIKTFDNAEALIACPSVELVDIAVPSTLHADLAIKALRAGKTVFLEKPIATRLADAREMVAVAGQTGSKLYFRHNRRFEPAFQHIREIIASGKIGEVYSIKLHRHGYQRRADWQTLMSCGGGQLNNWGPHIIDHSLRFLDGEVASIWSNLKRIAAVGDAEDHLKIVFTGKSGCIVDMEISGGVASAQPVYVVAGTRGSLTSDENRIRLRYLDPFQKLAALAADPGTPSIDGSFGNAEKLHWIEEDIEVGPALDVHTDDIWDYLYDTLRNGAEFPIRTEEAMQVMEVIEEVKRGTEFAASTVR
jgi:predicted dehydrogenase